MKTRLQATGRRLQKKDNTTWPYLAGIFHTSQSGASPKRMNTAFSLNFDKGSMYSCSPDQNSASALSHQLFPLLRCESHEISGLGSVQFARQSAFTILEIILAMAVLALLSGAIYAISMAAMQATHETLEEELTIRRLEGFLRITRDAFLNLPSNGSVHLETANGNSTPDLYFEKGSNLFGIPSLGGGTLVLSARPRPNGTRTFSVLRIPQNVQGNDRDQLYEKGNWISLLPNVIKPHWSFFRNGEWLDEWPQGAGRPQLARLEITLRTLHDPIVAIFYLPPTSGIGAIPSLDDLLRQLQDIKNSLEQNGTNPNQKPLKSLPTVPPTPSR